MKKSIAKIDAVLVLAAMLLSVITGCGTGETVECSHNWGEGTKRVVSTVCSEVGICTYTCQSCDKMRVEQIKGEHTFGDWEYEEYTYTHQSPDGTTQEQISHRKIRHCVKCNYAETNGTPNHVCEIGSDNHTTRVIREGTCQSGEVIRSTCSVCGWYTDYEGEFSGLSH